MSYSKDFDRYSTTWELGTHAVIMYANERDEYKATLHETQFGKIAGVLVFNNPDKFDDWCYKMTRENHVLIADNTIILQRVLKSFTGIDEIALILERTES